MMWVGIGTSAVGVGSAIYGASASRVANNKALDAQQKNIDSLQYQPIDIEKLKAEATQNAIDNATNSLALERSLTPDVATARATLSKQVSDQLALGGKLGADTINTVNQAGRVAGSSSGIGSGSTVPLTAALLGENSQALQQQRMANAGSLLAANPLPVAGLDPGQVASAEIGNNNAQNQFNAAKVGLNANMINSQLNADKSEIGGNIGVASSLTNLIGNGIGAYGSTSTATVPSYASVLASNPNFATGYTNGFDNSNAFSPIGSGLSTSYGPGSR
jgi:hypothetical protein